MQAQDLEVGMEIKSEDSDWTTIQEIHVGAKTARIYVGADPTVQVGIVVPVTQSFSVK